jgi:hypothetical protein
MAGNGVNEVVVGTGRVIDGVTATTRGTAFQRSQLIDQTLMVEQFDSVTVEQRKQGQVDVTLGLVSDLIIDTMDGESFSRPHAARITPSGLMSTTGPCGICAGNRCIAAAGRSGRVMADSACNIATMSCSFWVISIAFLQSCEC